MTCALPRAETARRVFDGGTGRTCSSCVTCSTAPRYGIGWRNGSLLIVFGEKSIMELGFYAYIDSTVQYGIALGNA